MDWIGIIIQLILGAIGGYGIGRGVKQVSINPTVDAIVGLIGGYIGTWIVGLIPGLAGLVAGGGAADHGCANFPQLTVAKSARPPDLGRFLASPTALPPPLPVARLAHRNRCRHRSTDV